MWRIIEVDQTSRPDDTDLTDDELIGISIYLAEDFRKYPESGGVYQRAWDKIQPVVEQAIKRQEKGE